MDRVLESHKIHQDFSRTLTNGLTRAAVHVQKTDKKVTIHYENIIKGVVSCDCL